MAQSATTCKPFENPSKPHSVNQEDCRLSRIITHVVMDVNWMWQGVAHEFQFGLEVITKGRKARTIDF